MSREKHRVLVIEHEDTDNIVYEWASTDDDLNNALRLVNSCLRRGEMVTVSTTRMTHKQFDRLPDYEGDC